MTADYFGDGTFAHSGSNGVPVFVFPEPSTTTMSFFAINPLRGRSGPFSAGPYGSFVFLRADAAGKSGFGFPTGSVNFTDNGHHVQGDPFKLNSEGNTLNPNSIDTFSVGTHTIGAEYEGDQSFFESNAKPMTFTITMAPITTTVTATVNTTAAGDAD